jgi:hypothetical protein
MTKHTLGPWHIVEGEIRAGAEYIGVVYRTEAWSSGEPAGTEDQANARLIAAAPDLLAVLKAMVAEDYAETVSEMAPRRFLELHRQAKAAIAKAEEDNR